jgi:hypothetical protein
LEAPPPVPIVPGLDKAEEFGIMPEGGIDPKFVEEF